MSFGERLRPMRTNGEFVSASVAMKGRSLRMLLRISAALSYHVRHSRCDIRAGDGADSERVLIEFNETGQFSAHRKNLTNGSTCIALWTDVPVCVPQDYVHSAVRCDHVWRVPQRELVVTLDLAPWREAVRQAEIQQQEKTA